MGSPELDSRHFIDKSVENMAPRLNFHRIDSNLIKRGLIGFDRLKSITFKSRKKKTSDSNSNSPPEKMCRSENSEENGNSEENDNMTQQSGSSQNTGQNTSQNTSTSINKNSVNIREKYSIKAENVVAQINELAQKKVISELEFITGNQLPDRRFSTNCKFVKDGQELYFEAFATSKKESKTNVCKQIVESL